MTILTAKDGMVYTDGKGVYAKKVFLGIYDSPDNYYEVPEEEVPQMEEPIEEVTE